MTTSLAFAAAYRVDRIVAVGVLALRALRHVAIGRPLAGPPVEGLRVDAVGAAERPGWHPETGLYGFLHVPPGARRVLITDPARRYQPAAFDVIVPDRAAVREQLERGVASPVMTPRPLVRDVALHPDPTSAMPGGVSAVFGQVRDAAGGPVSLARLMVTTFIEGAVRRHLTWSAPDGGFTIRLPGERPDTIGGDPPWRVTRQLVVHAPDATLAADLARDFLFNLPAERDALDPDAPGSGFARRNFALRDTRGVLRTGAPGTDPTLPILGGQATRWDIELA
jgi:hypothetical protein